MAKKCLYCGCPLAKDDARFCNDCGRPQVAPVSASSNAAAPSAIKVKLPLKEYMHDDLSSAGQEMNSPASAASAAPVSPGAREQALPPSSRLPKRPTRLTSQIPPASVESVKPAVEPVRAKPSVKPTSRESSKPVAEATSSPARQAMTEPPSTPTPAEEASTMVLPNWREELAQLRKEQEQARAELPGVPEKKPERASKEPPPLPRRSPMTPLPPHKVDSGDESSQAQPPRPPYTPRSAAFQRQMPDTPPVQASTRPAETPRRTPSTPLPPRESADQAELTIQKPKTPLPPVENARSMDAARRELRVKVWEQKKARSGSSSPEEKPLPGPAPAVEQSPFASVDFGVEEQTVKGDELENITWQKPLSPLPESHDFSATREEKSSSEPAEKKSWRREKNRAEGEPEKRLSQRGQGDPTRDEPQEVLKEERSRPFQREVLPEKSDQLAQEETDQGESKRQSQPKAKEDERTLKATEDQPDIEDLPTLRLAVPEQAKAEPSIKIERASTPAPKKWSVPRTDEIDVEDLPTRPMAASPGGSATSRATQAAASSSDQGTVQPSPSSGAFDATLATPPTKRNEDADGDAFASHSRTANASAPTSITFDPASLPPLPPGPLPVPGGSLPHPEMQGPPGVQARFSAPPGVPGQSAPQRPPSFEAAPASASATANAPQAATSGQVSTKKTPGKKHTGRLIVIIVLILVLVGGGVGIALKWDWVMQYFQSPMQNQPYQAYQNSNLGISLEYTQHWNVSADQAHNAVHFADSSHTGQVNLTVATASGQVSDYLNQQAVQLGITAPKAAVAATFGASSWQTLQGTVTQAGASYIAVLYATQHNGHFYLLEFLAPAPQANFRAIDQSDFTHMRSSFKFL